MEEKERIKEICSALVSVEHALNDLMIITSQEGLGCDVEVGYTALGRPHVHVYLTDATLLDEQEL